MNAGHSEHHYWSPILGTDAVRISMTNDDGMEYYMIVPDAGAITVDGRTFRVIGVLRKDFWFLDESPAVWSLFDKGTWRNYPVMLTGAIRRLTPGVAPDVAGRELRELAREVVPKQSGIWTNVMPLDSIARRPIDLLGPMFLGFAGVSCLVALGVLVTRGVLGAVFLLLAIVIGLTMSRGRGAEEKEASRYSCSCRRRIFWVCRQNIVPSADSPKSAFGAVRCCLSSSTLCR